MPIIAHRMDTSGEKGFLMNRKEVEKRVVVAERERYIDCNGIGRR